MDRILIPWYGWLSGLTQGAVVALGGWADRVELPLLGAVAFGLIGALSPCQLTTSLGALVILVGLGLLGLWRLRFGAGLRLAGRLREGLRPRGAGGAYLLGVVFSFAFCPTLFWLFFGLTVPLALRSAGGWSFPGLFALGASLPLLAAAGLVAAGVAAADAVAGGLRSLERTLRVAAGAVLLLAGLHDTLVYWVV